jgi:hypothetical protein
VVAVEDVMAEADSEVAEEVVAAVVSQNPHIIPSFHPLMGLTKVVAGRRFHLF